MYHYYQVEGGEEAWKPVQAEFLSKVIDTKHPMFVTVLATDKIASKEMPRDEKLALKYLGPMYVDFDSPDIGLSLAGLRKFCQALHNDAGLPQAAFRLYATGSKGFHVEIPLEVFMPRPPRTGVGHLPLVFKAIAMKYAQDTMDWRVYSIGMGRMWRQPNVERPNGKFKVPISWGEMETIQPGDVDGIVSQPRPLPERVELEMNLDLAVVFDKALQDVTEKIKSLKKRKSLPAEVFKRPMPSIDLLMQGKGVRPGAGFNQLAMQLAIYAREAGIDEDTLVSRCAGLIETHQSDGRRYNTPALRDEELRRMCRVIGDDPCYEFAAAPFRALLSHTAPDLDGIAVDPEEVAADVAAADAGPVEAEEGAEPAPLIDEYADVANGVELTKYGVYAQTEEGQRRISAVGFDNVRVLRSMDSGRISCVDAEVLVNGRRQGRQVLELDTFHTAAGLNKWMARYGHAFQGTEAQAKATFMRTVEKGKKMGEDVFVHEREGLAMVNIPHHTDERLRKPFLIWADGKGVVMEPRAAETGLKINFQGHPDPRGVYRCDLTDAPGLKGWLDETPANKETLRLTLGALFRCQRPDMVGPTLGWLMACFYKSIFQKAYNQFPLLHIAGAAGSGKSQMTMAMARLFYFNQEPRVVTPTSTVFALTQGAAGSDSIPMMIDEYKPIDMGPGVHDKLRLMFRDAYNARDIQRGGGNRDNDNFRALTTTTLTAPILFIAEGIEDETALMERVVLVTVAPPPSVVAHKWASRFYEFRRNAKLLSLIGKYVASKLVMTGYSVEDLMAEFDPLYSEARNRLMLTEADLNSNLAPDEVREKQSARERSVFNFTVAKFGLLKLQEVLTGIFGEQEFASDFEDFLGASYNRMKDLAPSTVPEYLKLMNVLVDLSYEAPDAAQAIRYAHEYGFGNISGKDTLELNIRSAYSRYRQHCRLISVKPLYAGEQAFAHGLRNVPSLMHIGEGQAVEAPGGVHVFDLADLMRLGLRGFRAPKGRH